MFRNVTSEKCYGEFQSCIDNKTEALLIKSGDWKIFFVFNAKIVFSFDNILVLHFFIFPLILGKSFVLGKSRIWENLFFVMS